MTTDNDPLAKLRSRSAEILARHNISITKKPAEEQSSTDAPPSGLERRETPRRPVGANDKTVGRIILKDTQKTIQVLFRDISERGARFKIPQMVPLPGVFVVQFDDGRTLVCEKRYQRDLIVGVRFRKS